MFLSCEGRARVRTSEWQSYDLMQHLQPLLKQKHVQQQYLTGLASFYFGLFGLWMTRLAVMFFEL